MLLLLRGDAGGGGWWRRGCVARPGLHGAWKQGKEPFCCCLSAEESASQMDFGWRRACVSCRKRLVVHLRVVVDRGNKDFSSVASGRGRRHFTSADFPVVSKTLIHGSKPKKTSLSLTNVALDSLSENSFTNGVSRGYTFLNKLARSGGGRDNDVTLEQMEQALEMAVKTRPEQVNMNDFLRILRRLAESELRDAPLKAERCLSRLEEFSAYRVDCLPTVECFQRVIEAWAKDRNENSSIAVTRAERWLFKHIDSPIESLRPDTACFNAFLDVCSKGRGLKKRGKNLVRTHAQKAEDTLNFMIRQRKVLGESSKVSPDVDSFNYVIRAWTRCRRDHDIVHNTMRILELLETYHEEIDSSVMPNAKSYTMVLDSLAVLAKLKAQQCRHRERHIENPEENGLEEIRLLENLLSSLQTKSGSLTAGVSAYNMLITAWSNVATLHEHAPFEAEKVLQRMITLKDRGHDAAAPDALSYTIIMRAWTNSQNPNRGKRVAWWLSKLWKDYDFEGRETLCPTTEAYNQVILSWARLGMPEEAEKVLNELLELHAVGKFEKLAPNSESFCLLIRAWVGLAEDGSFHGLEMATKWLNILSSYEEKSERFSAPVHLHSSILGAARQTVSSYPETLDLVLQVFEKIRNSHYTTNCIHYSRVLQTAILALSRPEHNTIRARFIIQLTEECCEDGLISSAYLHALCNGPVFPDGWTEEESRRLTEILFPEWSIPSSWTRNVKPDNFLPSPKDFERSRVRLSFHGDAPMRAG